MRLVASPPGRIVGGEIRFRDRAGKERDLVRLPAREMRRNRGRESALIFQEPMTSLKPTYNVGHQIGEAVVPQSDESPVGEEGVSTCRTRWEQTKAKKKHIRKETDKKQEHSR